MRRDTVKLIVAAVLILGIEIWGAASMAISIARGQESDVPALIHEYAAAYGANPTQMLRIARCESQFGTHWRTNHPSNQHRGVFQWERYSWAEVAPQIGVSADFNEAYSVPSNIAVSAYALAIGQAWRWSCK